MTTPTRTSIERRLNSDLAISLAGATLADGQRTTGRTVTRATEKQRPRG